MIFPVLEIEAVVQVGDMTRMNAAKSFVSKDGGTISKVEIRPEADGDWVEVTGAGPQEWFLDWQFSGATRTIAPACRVTVIDAAGDETDEELSKSMSVISVADDALFSADTDLLALEPDLLKWTPQGRSSFLNVHREAQTKILESLDESGIVDIEGAKLTKAAIVDVTEVRAWSRDLVLHLIFKGIYNAKDDVFAAKATFYASEVELRKARSVMRLDLDGDGEQELGEQVSLKTMDLVRR